jgi:CheY-like chemotaxis protein
MDGIATCRRIRELETAGELVAHVPIISVSANARSEQVSHAKEAGMDDYISKPFRIPELLPKIEMLARQWS